LFEVYVNLCTVDVKEPFFILFFFVTIISQGHRAKMSDNLNVSDDSTHDSAAVLSSSKRYNKSTLALPKSKDMPGPVGKSKSTSFDFLSIFAGTMTFWSAQLTKPHTTASFVHHAISRALTKTGST
jgi:hypothetical protein